MNEFMQQFSLDGKVAMVTGSAQGIGAEIAVVLGKAGATVVISDRDADLGAQQVSALEEQGIKAVFVRLDVTSESEWQAAINTVEQQLGRLDTLVNNAGIMFYEPVDTLSLEKFRVMQTVNVDGVFLGCKYAAALMKKNASADQRASIVNISSLAGLFGSAWMCAYSTSKGAVRLMSKALAAEYGSDHIRVNSVHPGLIQTDMGTGVQELLKARTGMNDEEATGFSLGVTPLRAFGTTQDVGGAVLFLASSMSNFMTATEIVVDGGIAGCT
jgi:NAD(P)-dependent dehydrogenase (short-subunit alcohol dehydrogenase family)